MIECKLPEWAKWKEEKVIVDIDLAYPIYLHQIGLEASQYSIGVVKWCITKDIVEITESVCHIVRFQGSGKWHNDNLPAGSLSEDPHGKGMQDAHKYRDKIIQMRAAVAIKAGMGV